VDEDGPEEEPVGEALKLEVVVAELERFEFAGNIS
jgi:hypothetical protein